MMIKDNKLKISLLCVDLLLLFVALVLIVINLYNPNLIKQDVFKILIATIVTCISISLIIKLATSNLKHKTILCWIFSIVIGAIGSLITAAIFNNDNFNMNFEKAEHEIYVKINGQETKVNKENANELYGQIEDEKNKLNREKDELNIENDALIEELWIYHKVLKGENPSYNEKEVSIFSFDPIVFNEWSKNVGTLIDSFNNQYEATFPYVIMNGESYAIYYTNVEFSKLKFTLAAHKTMMNNNIASVEIIVDDKVVEKIDGITHSFQPQTYTVDIEGSRFVKIKCNCDNENNSYTDTQVMLLDAQFIK